MVVVRIELWPKGDAEKSRLLGVCKISNDASSRDIALGNYDVALSHAGRYINRKGGPWKTGKVTGHRRSLSPYHLVYSAIKACLWPGKKGEKHLAEELQKAVWKRCDNLKNTLKNEEH